MNGCYGKGCHEKRGCGLQRKNEMKKIKNIFLKRRRMGGGCMMEKKELENMKIDLKEIEKDIQQFLDYIYKFYCNNDELLSEVEYFVNVLEEKYHIQLTYL